MSQSAGQYLTRFERWWRRGRVAAPVLDRREGRRSNQGCCQRQALPARPRSPLILGRGPLLDVEDGQLHGQRPLRLGARHFCRKFFPRWRIWHQDTYVGGCRCEASLVIGRREATPGGRFAWGLGFGWILVFWCFLAAPGASHGVGGAWGAVLRPAGPSERAAAHDFLATLVAGVSKQLN